VLWRDRGLGKSPTAAAWRWGAGLFGNWPRNIVALEESGANLAPCLALPASSRLHWPESVGHVCLAAMGRAARQLTPCVGETRNLELDATRRNFRRRTLAWGNLVFVVGAYASNEQKRAARSQNSDPLRRCLSGCKTTYITGFSPGASPAPKRSF